MRVFHYTTADRSHLGSILFDRVIRPTSVMIEERERPAVWFSTNSVWEKTANKRMMGKGGRILEPSADELAWLCGLARIEVLPETAPYTWEDFKARSGASSKVIRALEAAGRRRGASPLEWRVSFEAIPHTEWLRVERRFADGPWMELQVAV